MTQTTQRPGQTSSQRSDTWSYTFDEPPKFEYFCSPHPRMRPRSS